MSTGLQLPVVITKYGSIGSVTYPKDYVKKEKIGECLLTRHIALIKINRCSH